VKLKQDDDNKCKKNFSSAFTVMKRTSTFQCNMLLYSSCL